VEVSFDTDANGILTVTARDKETGKDQEITISGSTQLSKEEIDRMVRDSQEHAQEDRRRREEVEACNTADTLAYQVERQIQELGGRAPANERARAEQLISEIRNLVKSQSPDITRVRQLSSDLQQLGYSLSSVMHGQGPGEGSQVGTDQQPSDDDVIDTQYVKK
jgi:molecular chaperone DnaK